MGKRTNPNIFRLGKTKNWTSKYFEKKTTEAAVYNFKILEIKKFTYKFFKDNGLLVHNCKIFYLNENFLYIFVSYYLTLNSINIVQTIKKEQKIKLRKKIKNFINKSINNKNFHKKKLALKKANRLIIQQSIQNYTKYQNLIYFNNLSKILQKQNYLTAKKIIKQKKRNIKIKRIKFIKAYKKYLTIKKYKNIKTIETNNFLSKFFNSLHLFVDKKTNINLTVCQLNKNLKENFNLKKTKHLKTKLVNLKKYERNKFFKEGVNIIFNSINKSNSADLIAEFIATQLQKLKKHNYFLSFIKNVLLMFVSSNFSNLKGIKIKVKGRFNGRPRAKQRTLNIGKGVSNLTINSKIDYSEKTSYTSNGTLGVKIWTCEK